MSATLVLDRGEIESRLLLMRMEINSSALWTKKGLWIQYVCRKMDVEHRKR